MRKAMVFGVVLAAIAVSLSLTGSTSAQTATPPQQNQPYWNDWGPGTMGPGMMGGGGMMGSGAMGPWMMGGNGQGASMCTRMTSHIEGRLAYLKTELAITDAQLPLWNAYAGAARRNVQSMIAHCSAMMGQGRTALSLPDRIEQHEQFMAAQLDSLRATDKALRPLYASFSDAQRQSADQLMWGMMGMMM